MSPRLTRLELALVAIVFAIGLGLRSAYPSRMAVEHFDEGVYASNLYTPEGRFPFQHLYAPPLLPFCLEWAAIFGGPQAVMWVNVVSGSLTLLVLWGMVRHWWGPAAALAAMVLLAFNEFHIAYSRAALTDAMLGLWMTAGVWAGWRAIQFGGAVNLAAAGVLASLAWWTKYNGWLTLAITGAGTAGWILFSNPASRERQRPEETPGIKTARRKPTPSSARGTMSLAPLPPSTLLAAARLYLGRWLITAVVAFLVWSPWLWTLQQYGGYAAVAKNHAGYFTGASAWGQNAWRQLMAFKSSFDLYSSLGLVLCCLLPLLAFPGQFFRTRADGERSSQDCRTTCWQLLTSSKLESWCAAAWVLGFSVAIPLYTPYPRLILPLLLGLNVVIASLGHRNAGAPLNATDGALRTEADQKKLNRFRGAFLFMVVSLALPPYWELSDIRAWERRTNLSEASEAIVTRLQSEPLIRDIDSIRCALYVVAEPGLFFHLGAAQQNSSIAHVAIPAADFCMAAPGANPSGLPAYVVIGPHADQGEADRLIATGRLEPVAEFEYRPSDLVLLDSRPAWDLPDKENPVIERIRLLHVKQD